MSNIAGKAYAINVLTPVPPWRTWIQTGLFMLARVIPQQLSGLLGLKLIHFARWVIIRRNQWPDPGGDGVQTLDNDYMLFLSNFNGTWDQYIDAFADGIPSGLDLFWYTSIKYPHSIPISMFKAYIGANQIQTNHYYNATPGAAQRDIKAALRVRRELLALADFHRRGDATAFAQAYRLALSKVPIRWPRLGTPRSPRWRHRMPMPPGANSSTLWRQSVGLSMPNLDGGHYFLTVLAPIRVDLIVDKIPGRSRSHRHQLAQKLALLATGRQTAASPPDAWPSPFAANTLNHLARFVIIGGPPYNGRLSGDTLLGVVRNINPLTPQPVDRLSVPYLLFAADIDAAGDGDAALRVYTDKLWATMNKDLVEIFKHCAGFDGVDTTEKFNSYIRKCQVETTMPFNDYGRRASDRERRKAVRVDRRSRSAAWRPSRLRWRGSRCCCTGFFTVFGVEGGFAGAFSVTGSRRSSSYRC